MIWAKRDRLVGWRQSADFFWWRRGGFVEVRCGGPSRGEVGIGRPNYGTLGFFVGVGWFGRRPYSRYGRHRMPRLGSGF